LSRVFLHFLPSVLTPKYHAHSSSLACTLNALSFSSWYGLDSSGSA
jgi:hypothetical protein